MSVTIPESFYTSLLAGVGVVQENVIKTFNLVLTISKWTDFFKVQRLLRTVSHYVPTDFTECNRSVLSIVNIVKVNSACTLRTLRPMRSVFDERLKFDRRFMVGSFIKETGRLNM